MKSFLQFGCIFGLILGPAIVTHAQLEGPVPTQVLVSVDAKSTPPEDASVLTVSVDNRKEPLTDWQPLLPANSQLALLIDDGLRESVGRELNNLHAFVRNLPPGVEVLVGYMQSGRVVSEQPFTANHELAASTLHLPTGLRDASASPYLCLSDFVKQWPGGAASSSMGGLDTGSQRKARFVLMITDGVDPYNGSTKVTNQDSPYVAQAVTDAQRAGVSVSALYFADAGLRGESADNSGQNYLLQLAQGTGGTSLWEGTGNPVSMAPYLADFQRTLAETYIATFPTPAGKNPRKDLVYVKFSAPKVKLHAPDAVRPGNQE